MVQHMKICQCNQPYKQTERKKHMIISSDAEKNLWQNPTFHHDKSWRDQGYSEIPKDNKDTANQ